MPHNIDAIISDELFDVDLKRYLPGRIQDQEDLRPVEPRRASSFPPAPKLSPCRPESDLAAAYSGPSDGNNGRSSGRWSHLRNPLLAGTRQLCGSVKATLALLWILAAVMGYGNPLAIATGSAQLAMSADGTVGSLKATQTGTEWLTGKPATMFSIQLAGRTYPSSQLVSDGNVMHVSFGSSGVVADYRITAHSDYVVITLLTISSHDVTEVRLAEFQTSLPTIGTYLTLRSSPDLAVSLVGMSDRVNARIENGIHRASVYPAFGMAGESVALIMVTPSRLLDVVREVELEAGLPSPTIGGQWAKYSQDVRTSYFLTDLSEDNADGVIKLAKSMGLKYILIVASAWSRTSGSYQINTYYYPHGEAGVKATVDKCHAAGLKVGLHFMANFVEQTDPLATPTPDTDLLKDATATLASNISAGNTSLSALENIDYMKSIGGTDVQIDQELIHYQSISGTELVSCIRGYNGTVATSHAAGTNIHHLATRYGYYLADLRTSLKEQITTRISGLVNQAGFDMLYIDGGNVTEAMGPSWYWQSQFAKTLLEKISRDVIIQSAVLTPYLWHIVSRMTCDDNSMVATKAYMDWHKIADFYLSYSQSGMPAELGWWSVLTAATDHLATVPDEAEAYAVRMLALGIPFSLNGGFSVMQLNGRMEEIRNRLSEFETLRLGGTVSPSLRSKLQIGEWNMITENGKVSGFEQVVYDTAIASSSGKMTIQNHFTTQPFHFRLRVLPVLNGPDSAGNIELVGTPLTVTAPSPTALMPGALAKRVILTQGGATGGVNLSEHRALAIKLRIDAPLPESNLPGVINIQLESSSKQFRDYYIDLNFTGEKTIVLTGPDLARILKEFRPNSANYYFKNALSGFDYSNVVALNIRWMRLAGVKAVNCSLISVQALQETETAVSDLKLSMGGNKLSFPMTLHTDDYVEVTKDSNVRVFDKNGVLQAIAPILTSRPMLSGGMNEVVTESSAAVPLELTVINSGQMFTLDGAAQNPISESPQGAKFAVSITHVGNFVQGQLSASYTISVSNGASGAASAGTATITEAVPLGLTLVSMTGAGWACSSNTCTRSDALGAGGSYPAITVIVNVGASSPGDLINEVTLLNGSLSPVTVRDATTVVPTSPGKCVTSVTPLDSTVVGIGGTLLLEVESNSGCEVRVSIGASWITLNSLAVSNGKQVGTFTVAPNSGAQRSANVQVGEIEITIIQAPQQSGPPLRIRGYRPPGGSTTFQRRHP